MNETGAHETNRHPVLLGILIVIIVAILISVIADTVKTNKAKKAKDTSDFVTMEDPSYKAEKEVIKAMKKEQSDIKGMTKYDKYSKGLDPKDGSDTDGDGLTDKEEIEKYHTDPHKMSTSGDLYTDGEKVEKGLPLDRKNDFKGKITYKNNTASDTVKLSATSAYGRFASVTDVTGMDSFDGKNVYAEYAIEHFEGTLSVTIKKIVKDKKADKDKLTLYLADGGGKAEHIKTVLKGDTLKSDKEFKAGKRYTLYVADEGVINLPEKVRFNAAIPEFGSRGFDGIVYGSPLLNMVSGELNIMYLKNPDSTIEKNEKEALVLMANNSDSADMDTSSRKIKPATQSQIDSKYSMLKKLLPLCNGQTQKDNPIKLLFWYDRLENGADYLSKNDMSFLKRDTVATGFDISKNAFPFQNFSTKDTSGVCAGIASYTALMYNEGSVPYTHGTIYLNKDKSDSLDFDIRGKAFDKMKTSKLHDFKDKDYINRHKDKNGLFVKDLDADDKNFANAMVYYLSYANNSVNEKEFESMRYQGSLEGDASDDKFIMTDSGYSYSTIEWIKKRISSGKIVSVGMTMGTDRSSKGSMRNGEEGHVVTLYGYTDFDNGETIFNVYDSNFPQRKDLVMYVKKCKSFIGWSFYYKYQPVVDGWVSDDYIMTNMKNGRYNFNVLDERDFSDKAEING